MTGLHGLAYPDEIIREALEAERWTVTEAAVQLGVTYKRCPVFSKVGQVSRRG